MRTSNFLCAISAAALALVSCAVSAAGYSREELLGMLRSGDAEQRALARQLLPREGVERVGDIVAVLADPNEAVWRTASNVLADIANEVSAPGREADRRLVADALLARLAQRPGRDEAARLLNIVHLVLPEGTDVSPIAIYLDDESLRMNARDALQLATTAEARGALRAALEHAEGTFELALIDSLGQLRDANSRDALLTRLSGRDAAVRTAAARALAWTGDADLVPRVEEVVRKAPKDGYVEAGDALLSLADAMARNGGQYDRAIDLYAWALRNLRGPELRGAAIAALGRHGDERAVPWIIDAAGREKSGTLDHAALEALAALPGETATRAIFTNRDALFDLFGPSLYGVYGRRGGGVFLPILIDALQSDDDYARHVAALALLDADRSPGIDALAKYAAQLDGPPRDQLVDALELKAASYRRDRRADAAGAAYAGLYRLATTDKAKKFALGGMMQFPSEEAFALVTDLVDQHDLAEFPVPFLAGIARALQQSNRTGDAARILDALVPRLATPDDVRAFLDSARAAGLPSASRLGFILNWRVVGPFPWSASDGFGENYIGAPEVDVTASYSTEDGEKRSWTSAQASAVDGVLNLIGVLGDHANAAAYAFAEIDVPEATDAVLRMGSDDGAKVWLNGDVVHENHVDRGLLADQDRVPVPLRAGRNRLVLEITQGGGGWAVCVRLTKTDGGPLEFSQ
jgi:HEAT repeat protein